MSLLLATAALAALDDPCAAMGRAKVADVRIVSATAVGGDAGFTPPDKRALPVTVDFCRIEGVIEKEIGFELWLPIAKDWNGHFLAGGVGGQAGQYNYRELSRGVRRGYASASTDTGHKASDRHWLLGDPMRAANYAGRSNHLLAVKAKALVRHFYGTPARRALFVGCSGGGRQALTEAQRYPTDYDGIIAGAPGARTPEMSARRMWEMVQHSASRPWMTAAQWALIAKAGVEACDGADGVKDGVVENPATCRFRPADLLCRAGQAEACLTPQQAALATRIYGPLIDETGRRVDDGLLPGVPVSPTPLPEPFTPGPPYLAVALFGDGVHRDPNWNPATFRVGRDLAAIDKVMDLHADNPDLTRFRDHGGKLLMYQGWIDPLVEARTTIDYLRAVEAKMGGPERTAQFVRLYMAPGVDHCVGGPGADQLGGAGGDGIALDPEHDMLSALEAWLDSGEGPGTLIAAKRDGTAITRTRPLCPYPLEARYDGTGDADVARSYRCAKPAG
ncbi:tannase/feruloyl esterase family alpha/beta hydrolase [Sphingomonas naphthae]|uniref:Tannase/feruloyl esterase family alpha/beta hydrolase n=1 Tax=Sphingomonas naphthae TaxID=1813468 RepID=A0ABY7TGT4_9SPHN|nr:tannase/feruloyl esterase family alpha/beta hydrolase [Sphingomonas naphthae]WCT72423.1 tannase/feruloyl esterase family alpha/beta hydrolase [Sphingomonas naphthae]